MNRPRAVDFLDDNRVENEDDSRILEDEQPVIVEREIGEDYNESDEGEEKEEEQREALPSGAISKGKLF